MTDEETRLLKDTAKWFDSHDNLRSGEHWLYGDELLRWDAALKLAQARKTREADRVAYEKDCNQICTALAHKKREVAAAVKEQDEVWEIAVDMIRKAHEKKLAAAVTAERDWIKSVFFNYYAMDIWDFARFYNLEPKTKRVLEAALEARISGAKP